MMPSSTRWVALGVAVYLFLVVFVAFLPLSLSPATHLPDEGDALQTTWMMAWVAHQLPKDPLNLFDANLYYPHPRGLTYSEHFIPQGMVVWLFETLGANLILSYNLLALVSLIAVALATRSFAKELGGDEIASSGAALIAAVSTFTLGEVSRLHILFMPFIPLALTALVRFFRTGAAVNAVQFALLFFLQGLASHYYLISFPIFLAPFLVALAFHYRERVNRKDAWRLGLPLAIACVLYVPVEIPYLKTFDAYGFRQPLPEGADLARYLVPPADNVLFGRIVADWAPLAGANEHFIGLLPLVLGLVGILALWHQERSANRFILFWLVAQGLVFVLLSAGSELRIAGHSLGYGLYRLLYEYVPFFEYARVPERLCVYFSLGWALVAGLGLSSVVRRWRSQPLVGALCVVVFLLLLPLEHFRWPSRPYPRVPIGDEVPDVYRWLAAQPADFAIAEFPVYTRGLLRFAGYEDYFSTFHWKRIVFGRPSFYPPALEYLLWNFSGLPARDTVRMLQALDVRMVVYHPHRPGHSDAVLRRLKRDPRFQLLTAFGPASPAAEALGYGDEWVFAVQPEAIPPPPPELPNLERIPVDGWRFETSSLSSDPVLAIDGDLDTSWSSGAPQEKGQFFDVDLGGEYWVAKIDLAFTYPYSEFPRVIFVNGFHTAHRWRRLVFRDDPWEPARMVQDLVADPRRARLELRLEEPMALERIRAFIPQTLLGLAIPDWKIPEIEIYSVPPRVANPE